MNVGELRAILELLPDDTEIHVSSATHHGICHVDAVRRNLPANGRLPSVTLVGHVSWEAQAPEVTRQGRWPRKPSPVATPVDREKVTAGLLALLRGELS